MFRKVAVAFAIWLVPALALAASVERRDSQIFKDVSKEVLTYTQFTIFDDVAANVHDGVVTLTGDVTMPYKRNDIGRRVAGIDGVARVDNRIRVLPVSPFDDRLRSTLARRIYGSLALSPYASMVNPPIHVIVENGRVTLTGTVLNEADRAMAGAIVSSVPSFSVTNRLKTEAEVRAELERMGSARRDAW